MTPLRYCFFCNNVADMNGYIQDDTTAHWKPVCQPCATLSGHVIRVKPLSTAAPPRSEQRQERRLPTPDELPGGEAHARNSDPGTSHEAAASVGNLRASQRAVLDCIGRCGPATDEHWIAAYREWGYPKQSVSGLRTRRSEVHAAGLIADTGQRQLTESGRRSIVWTVT